MGICLLLKGACRPVRLLAAKLALQHNELNYRGVQIFHSPSDEITTVFINNVSDNKDQPYYRQIPIAHTPPISIQYFADITQRKFKPVGLMDARQIINSNPLIDASFSIDLRSVQEGHFSRFKDDLMRMKTAAAKSDMQTLADSQRLTGVLAFLLADLSFKHLFNPTLVVPRRRIDSTFGLSLMSLSTDGDEIGCWLSVNKIPFNLQPNAQVSSPVFFEANLPEYPAFTLFDSTAGIERGMGLNVDPQHFPQLAKVVAQAYKIASVNPQQKTPMVDVAERNSFKKPPKQGRSVKPQHRII